MTDIVVNDEQARMILESKTPVVIRDRRGRQLGEVVRVSNGCGDASGPTPDKIAELEKRLDSAGPWYTTEDVLAHLRSLES